MLELFRIPALVLFTVVVSLVSCVQSTSDEDFLKADFIRVLSDTCANSRLELTNGNGVLLSSFRKNTTLTRFVLWSYSGEIRWEKDLDIQDDYLITAENDNTFTIFSGGRKLTLSYDGNVGNVQDDYLKSLDGHSLSGVLKNSKGNYIFYGTLGDIATRYGFLAELDPDGKRVFRSVYKSYTTFTACVESETGYAILGHTYQQLSSYFVLLYGTDGKLQQTYQYRDPLWDGNSSALVTSSLLRNDAGSYLAIVSRGNSWLHKISGDGSFLDSIELCSDQSRIIKVSGQTEDGGFSALINTVGYYNGKSGKNGFLRVSGDLKSIREEDIQNVYPDGFNAICNLDDGRTAIWGRIAAFGAVYKPILIIR